MLDPALNVPLGDVALQAGLAGIATIVSAVAATALLRRLQPAELLREA